MLGHYNTVNPYNRHLIGECSGVYCDFQFWFMLCPMQYHIILDHFKTPDSITFFTSLAINVNIECLLASQCMMFNLGYSVPLHHVNIQSSVAVLGAESIYIAYYMWSDANGHSLSKHIQNITQDAWNTLCIIHNIISIILYLLIFIMWTNPGSLSPKICQLNGCSYFFIIPFS